MTSPTTSPTPDTPVGVREIADLLAWARRLSQAGRHADPADRAAFLTVKTDLLARVVHPHDENDHTDKQTPENPR